VGKHRRTFVTQEDFYRPDHQLIFAAIGTLAGKANPAT